MTRPARSKSATGIYHVMLHGNECNPVFSDDEDKKMFIDIMLQKKAGAANRLYAYCVMDNHVHAVIQEIEQPLAIFMKRIGITYAAYFNKKYHRSGHVFQDRFRSESIGDEAYLLNVIRYIHKNPITTNANPIMNYPWSSYPSYMEYKESFPLLPEMENILTRFSPNRKKAIQLFGEFHSAEETQQPFLDIVDETDDNAEEVLKAFLRGQSILLEELKQKDNRLVLAELIQKLLLQSKISCRQIAKLIGINRETVRKMAKADVKVTIK